MEACDSQLVDLIAQKEALIGKTATLTATETELRGEIDRLELITRQQREKLGSKNALPDKIDNVGSAEGRMRHLVEGLFFQDHTLKAVHDETDTAAGQAPCVLQQVNGEEGMPVGLRTNDILNELRQLEFEVLDAQTLVQLYS